MQDFNVLETYLNGEIVAEHGISKIENLPSDIVNNFKCETKKIEDFAYENSELEQLMIKVIEVLDGQLITLKTEHKPKISDGFVVSDTERDILKIVVVNRYQDAPPAIAFIKNFGLKEGAIASSVAHDSHNIIAVGVDDESICEAVNMIIEARGGVSAINGKGQKNILKLPIAGIMSDRDGYEVAKEYSDVDQFAKQLGCTLASPFMSLSFMALLVIPNLKLSDLGLFDGEKFTFTSLFVK